MEGNFPSKSHATKAAGSRFEVIRETSENFAQTSQTPGIVTEGAGKKAMIPSAVLSISEAGTSQTFLGSDKRKKQIPNDPKPIKNGPFNLKPERVISKPTQRPNLNPKKPLSISKFPKQDFNLEKGRGATSAIMGEKQGVVLTGEGKENINPKSQPPDALELMRSFSQTSEGKEAGANVFAMGGVKVFSKIRI